MIDFSKLQQHHHYNHGVFLLNFLFATWLAWWITTKLPRLHDILMVWVMLNFLWLPRLKLLRPPFFLLLFLWVIISPIIHQYGHPNAGMIASALETNITEAQEFFDGKLIIDGLSIITGFIFIVILSKKVIPTAKQTKFFIGLTWILTVFLIGSYIKLDKQNGHFHLRKGFSRTLGLLPAIGEQYQQYDRFKSQREILIQQKNDWQITQSHQTYHNYVLIIGESASKNYLSAYGYPVDNSPFLSTVNGIKYTNMITPAAHTSPSVPRLLTIPDKTQVQYHNSIITLANQANFNTFWLSNQGKIGEYDSASSYLALLSQERFYLQDNPKNQGFDSELLPLLQIILHQTHDKPNLIVLHLMGSHAAFCKRLEPTNQIIDFSDTHLPCYLATLRQTDQFLYHVYQKLQQTGQSFSMVYVSDHALKPLTLKHGISQDSLKVPLFKISSDDQQQTVNHAYISGMSFVWFLSEWLGIKTQNQVNNPFLTDYHYKNAHDIWVFDDTPKKFSDLESFNDQVLLPDD